MQSSLIFQAYDSLTDSSLRATNITPSRTIKLSRRLTSQSVDTSFNVSSSASNDINNNNTGLFMIRNQFVQRLAVVDGEESGEIDNNINNSHLLGIQTTESTHINFLLRKQLEVANSSVKTLEGVYFSY